MSFHRSFYVTGGTLAQDAPSYIRRQADEDLYQGLLSTKFCYVLTSRQMGKSSLMVRAAIRLRLEGIAVAMLDLTSLGVNLTVEQWYDGLLMKMGEQLDLENELDEIWEAHSQLSPLQRWLRAVETVLPAALDQPVVVFIDEIDLVRSLPFSVDEFFAAIRECYNKRSEQPALRQLTFCLLGVAAPSDLIQNVRMTPFNIGRRIELHDFNETEAAPLAQGLQGEKRSPDIAATLLRRVLFWTGGHPYLTQLLCQAIAQDSQLTKPSGVDRLCKELFFSSRAREQDNNLVFVRDRLLRSKEDRASLLDLYQQVRKRGKVADDDTNPLVNILRLSGLVRVKENCLQVRNRIYGQVFSQDWINANMPDAEKRRQRIAFRRGAFRAGLIAGVIILSLFGGWYWYMDGYVWDHVSYYNNYAKRFGVMVGVGELTEEQVRHRRISLRFHQKGRRTDPVKTIYKVEAINSFNELTTKHNVKEYLPDNPGLNDIDQECQWEYVRNAKGKIVYEQAYNKTDNLVRGLVYSPRVKGDPVRAHYVGLDGFPLSYQKTAAEFVEFEYSPQGDERVRRYYDRYHNHQVGPDGYHKLIGKYDEQGNQIERAYFDKQGKPTLQKNGYHKSTTEYDEFGNQTEWALFDEQEKPTLQKNGFHKSITKYDKHGNQIEWACFDEVGKPTLYKEGFHKVTYRRDNQGNPIEGIFFNEQGKPTLHKGCHKITNRHDSNGNVIEWACFDEHGKPTLYKEGYHKSTAKYDARGNRTEENYFDIEGNPTLHKDGYHKSTQKYDTRGNQIEWASFDEDGKPTLFKNGYHKSTKKYDARGNKIERACFDEQNKPVRDKDGDHKIILQYDKKGYQVEKAYLDEYDNSILHKDGYHKLKLGYDNWGRIRDWAYFDVHGKLTLHKNGYYLKTAKYNNRGHKIEEAYFDKQKTPTRHKDGYHKFAAKYDARGNRTEESYFDAQGDPVFHNDGYQIKKAKYNSRGNRIEETYFEEKGHSALHKNGYHIFAVQYDARGNQTEESYFDTQGTPTLHKDGYHKMTCQYDAQSNQINKVYYDEKGQPMPDFQPPEKTDKEE